jgi:hypothetical protein
MDPKWGQFDVAFKPFVKVFNRLLADIGFKTSRQDGCCQNESQNSDYRRGSEIQAIGSGLALSGDDAMLNGIARDIRSGP